MDINGKTWRKSTRCGSNACVEVAQTSAAHVRDSKLPDSAPFLTFDARAWGSFLAALRTGTV